MKAVDLRCEFVADPIGIGEVAPRLSWRMEDDRPEAVQSAWQIRAFEILAGNGISVSRMRKVWDTGKVNGWQSLDHEYGGPALRSRSRIAWQTRIWDAGGEVSAWSDFAYFEVGLLEAEDWKARWISRPVCFDEHDGQPSPYLRKEFTLRSKPVSARLYVSALGLYEVHLNGSKVGGGVFVPGWTYFDKRVQSQTYDVTDMLCKGRNAIGGFLGAGQYAGVMPYNTVIPHRQLALLAQLEVEFPDGRKSVIATDRSWRTSFGPILSSEFWHGETYDARLEMPLWDRAGFDDSRWDSPILVKPPTRISVDPARSPSVSRQIEINAVALSEPLPGVYIFDLGQNMVGWARIKVRAPRGARLQARFGEMVQSDGTLYTENLTIARCTDVYISKGDGVETWEPTFTYRGFRYVELTGVVGNPSIDDVTGVVVFSAMDETADFTCSNPLLSKFHENVRWGMRGNFLDVPTDCPQRGERLGWTGDAQIFARTAMTLYNSSSFFTKWGRDLLDSQSPKGAFSDNAPNIFLVPGGWSESEKEYPGGNSGWGDAGVVCPWTQYLCFGDRRILERHYESMAKWIEWQKTKSRDLILDSAIYGDWCALDIHSFNPQYERKLTPTCIVSTAYFALTTRIMRDVSSILGKKADARKYAALLARIKKAFVSEFVSPAGRIVSETQTSYLLALGFDLLPERLAAKAASHLVRRFADYKDHLCTGFIGTPLVCDVLARTGHGDLAYKVLLNKDFPGWLYPVTMGATTIWENWNGYTKELGFGFGSKGTGSFNHYAYGSVAAWFYSSILGIDFDESDPGYHHVLFRPVTVPAGQGKDAEDRLDSAEGHVDTRYGRISSHWERQADGKIIYTLTIPANTSASIMLPGTRKKEVGAGTWRFVVKS